MKKLLTTILLIFPITVTACEHLYPNNTRIVAVNSVELCNSFYVTVYNAKEHRVLFTSERLQGNMVGSTTRVNSFRMDSRITNGPSNTDYALTGMDRGHMAPADDASSELEARDTFLLSNMTPQEPTLNRKAWKVLEDHVRDLHLANSITDTHVLTIAVYSKPQYMGRIPKPTGYWKIVYKDNSTKYFYADNLPEAQVMETTIVNVVNLIK